MPTTKQEPARVVDCQLQSWPTGTEPRERIERTLLLHEGRINPSSCRTRQLQHVWRRPQQHGPARRKTLHEQTLRPSTTPLQSSMSLVAKTAYSSSMRFTTLPHDDTIQLSPMPTSNPSMLDEDYKMTLILRLSRHFLYSCM